MLVYAGIDEAGYGPAFGPLTVGCCVLGIPKLEPGDAPPQLWSRLRKGVSRTLRGRAGRVVINDSKKLTTPTAGIAHLETGCLAVANLAGFQPNNAGAWLDALGETSHHQLNALPWYGRTKNNIPAPWQPLPTANDPNQLAIARGLFTTTAHRIGVQALHMGVSVVFEDRFNAMVAATRSKAAVNLTFIAGHLQHLWKTHGEQHPLCVVDRQSGRSHYRPFIAQNFPNAALTVLHETVHESAYVLEQGPRRMTLRFPVAAESDHMPVAIASMIAKYSRELMMARFKAWFTHHVPHIKPTAGYGSDAKRFWQEIRPQLESLNIDPAVLRRRA
ncbi:MAG: hypothetical protein V3V20_05325 [Algisphaera sp.]